MHIVIITSSAQHLFGLRKELVLSWVKDGHRVTAIGELEENIMAQRCLENGFSYRKVTLERNGLNPQQDYKTLKELTSLLQELQPDRVFCTFAKAVAYGAWAARKAGIKNTFALISGLGSVFRGKSFKERLVCQVMSSLYKNAFKGCKKIIFQNNDDLNELLRLRLLTSDKAVIVNGSGVDLNKFSWSPIPNSKQFLFVGRLLREKGIREFLDAASIVKEKVPDAKFLVVGDIDSNPSSLSSLEVDRLQELGRAEFFGFQSDVRPFIKQSDVFVLPSYHEGTPRCVLEAMSCGRPIITTDAPGCRETVRDGDNGFLVPVGDSISIADRMMFFIENPSIIQKMGTASRKIAEQRYDVNSVLSDYRKIMNL